MAPSSPQEPSRPQPFYRTLLATRQLLLLSVIPLIVAGFSPPLAAAEAKPSENTKGEQLARALCATCHLFPEPHLLDQRTWEYGALKSMQLFLGRANETWKNHPEAHFLEGTSTIPASPLVSDEDYRLIKEYFLSQAPSQPIPQAPKTEPETNLSRFRIINPGRQPRLPPATTLVQIPTEGGFYLGNGAEQNLVRFTTKNTFSWDAAVQNTPIALTTKNGRMWVASIGNLFPSEAPRGDIREFTLSGKPRLSRVVSKNLPRTTHLAMADLNQDNQPDFVVSQFGHINGKLSIFASNQSGGFEETVLYPKPGALQSYIQDVNADGRPNIVTLFGQATEGLMIFDARAPADYQPIVGFKRHPLFGHAHFELADFNGDKLPDALVSNGDNGEYSSPPKAYHGVRIYLNEGDYRFREAFFYPLHGAFRALARDFDNDGDLDIAAISFFPDYVNRPNESFVYLENRGNFTFQPSTIKGINVGRWLVMDAGDTDLDGDIDLVLGSMIFGPAPAPQLLQKSWRQNGPPYLVLENTTIP